MQPMYLAYSPPMMLPTRTMNPTATATAAAAATGTARGRTRRTEERVEKRAGQGKVQNGREERMDMANLVWWLGVGMTVLGGAAYLS